MRGRRRMLVAALWRSLRRPPVACGVVLAGWGQGHSVVRLGAAHAHRLLRTVAQPNVGEFVDALHWSRAAATLDEVSALPREWIHYVQICDGRQPGPATREGLIHDALGAAAAGRRGHRP
jgi:sugar phosphate isomerase/epimerase